MRLRELDPEKDNAISLNKTIKVLAFTSVLV